jgi:hypothetical protein
MTSGGNLWKLIIQGGKVQRYCASNFFFSKIDFWKKNKGKHSSSDLIPILQVKKLFMMYKFE